jgi:hypothetical protein
MKPLHVSKDPSISMIICHSSGNTSGPDFTMGVTGLLPE